MKRRKLHRHRIERTPEQLAVACSSAREAFKLGKEVHRAYLQQQIAKLPQEKKNILYETIKQFKKNEKGEISLEEENTTENTDKSTTPNTNEGTATNTDKSTVENTEDVNEENTVENSKKLTDPIGIYHCKSGSGTEDSSSGPKDS